MKAFFTALILLSGIVAQARIMFPACEERVNCTARSNTQISSYRDLLYDALLNDREKMNLESPKFKAMSEGDRSLMQSFKSDSSLSKSVRFIDDVIAGSCDCNQTVDFLSNALANINELTRK